MPLGVRAQPQAGKVPRIGYLRVTSASDRPPLLDAFRQALRELRWIEGQNIVIDYRFAEGGIAVRRSRSAVNFNVRYGRESSCLSRIARIRRRGHPDRAAPA